MFYLIHAFTNQVLVYRIFSFIVKKKAEVLGKSKNQSDNVKAWVRWNKRQNMRQIKLMARDISRATLAWRDVRRIPLVKLFIPDESLSQRLFTLFSCAPLQILVSHKWSFKELTESRNWLSKRLMKVIGWEITYFECIIGSIFSHWV